jgi:cytochrome c-type biogenesis protein CcmH/NrfF
VRLGIAALLALIALAMPGLASAATPRASFNDIEDELMCVTCHVPLNIAESVQADQERAEIHKLIDRGLTKKQVLHQMALEYGDGILGDPPDKGFNIATRIVPIGVVVALLALLAVVVPRWRRSRSADDDPSDDSGPALSPTESRKLDEDLARYEV